MRSTGLAILTLALLGCEPSGAAVANAERRAPTPGAPVGSPPTFVLSSNPNDPIIRVEVQSRFLLAVPFSTYTLYGDGRLELAKVATRKDEGAPPAPPARNVRLDADELHSLAALAAAPVLIEGKDEELASEFQRAGSFTMDGSDVKVDIRLLSYSRGAVHLAPVERTFRMVDPTIAAKYGFGGEAVKALAAIVDGLHQQLTAKEREQ